MGEPSRSLLDRLPWLGPLLLLLLIIGALATVWYSGVVEVRSEGDLRDITDDYGFWGPLAYVVLYAVVAFVFPVSFLTAAGGVLFGKWSGLFLSVIGAILGGLISFLAVRYLGVRSIEGYLSQKRAAGGFLQSRIRNMSGLGWFRKRFAAIEEPDDLRTEIRSVFTLFLLRMLGPFFAISFLASLSRISFRAYMAGTILGAIVANYLLLVFTESLLDLRNLGDLASWDIAVPLLLFLIVVAIPYLYLRLQARADGEDEEDEIDDDIEDQAEEAGTALKLKEAGEASEAGEVGEAEEAGTG